MNITAKEVFDSYKGQLLWLPSRTIVLMKHGSHAYGTATPTSDIDIKGVAVPPKEFLLGFCNRFEQADKGFGEYDCAIYGLQKFMALAAQNNPNIIELAFIDQGLIHVTPEWELIQQNRNLFLSQDCKFRFTGYAVSQLKRIRTHREWLLNPPKHQPTRTEFGLPEFPTYSADQRKAADSQIQKQIDAWRLDLAEVEPGLRIQLLRDYEDALEDIALHSSTDIYTAAARKLSFDDNFMEIIEQERGYRAALQRWKQYNEWVKTRNPKRAELEQKYGYDTKHGMHLVRLMRMAQEIVGQGTIIVHRPDAEQLLAIRNGLWSYDQLVEWAARQEQELNKLLVSTPLPKKPNRTQLDKLCIQIVEKML